MGNRRMQCFQCGNENVNEILVTFEYDGGIRTTTTLAKFLYYLEHPTDKRVKVKRQTPAEQYLDLHKDHDPHKIEKVIYYSCHNCHETKEIEGKTSNVGLRIPSRRYGI